MGRNQKLSKFMSLYLYNLSLQKPGIITQSVVGNFLNKGSEEVLISRENVLELFRIDEANKPQTVITTQAFGTIRTVNLFSPFGLS